MKDKYVICGLLVIVIICAVVLLYKENNRYKYDEEKYASVYREYNEIIEMSKKVSENQNIIDTNIEQKENKEYDELLNNLRLVDSVLEIEKIDLFYPVTREMSDENLNISPTKFCGPAANTIGNYCIVGHNFHSEAHFGRLKELQVGDTVYMTDTKGKKVKYAVYDIYEVSPKDTSCTSQNNGGIREITLITCTNDAKKRLIVKCKEVK